MVQLLKNGKSNKEIGESLSFSLYDVKSMLRWYKTNNLVALRVLYIKNVKS